LRPPLGGIILRATFPEDQMNSHLAIAALAAGLVVSASPMRAQATVPGSAATAPDTGVIAPDFTLPGSTRFGLLKEPIKLSNFRGQTVVLAFFPKARTKG